MECIICEKQVNNADKSVVHKPRPQGLISLLSYAEKRQDKAGKRILQQKDGILSGNVKVKFHYNCRKSYTSLQNIVYSGRRKVNFPEVINQRLLVKSFRLILELCASFAIKVEQRKNKI
ncbi:hypothetical protein RI129_002875 [Pyrocoelia pectoralis]|uniref:Uncharacterized protein n=1 Tax=Pyrocoelia pectoralis TaxID=417401 RepID=A0AAN7VPE6_9COLE